MIGKQHIALSPVLCTSDQQVNELTDEFHEWRNMGMASIAKSKQKICTFLHYMYLASGGYYRLRYGYCQIYNSRYSS